MYTSFVPSLTYLIQFLEQELVLLLFSILIVLIFYRSTWGLSTQISVEEDAADDEANYQAGELE